MMTIREIAAALGKSKQAVHQRIKRPPLSTALRPLTSTVNGVFHVAPEGVKLIYQAFGRVYTGPGAVDASVNIAVNVDGNVDGKRQATVDGAPDAALRDIVEVLRQQLEVKDRQIATLSDALLKAQDAAKAAQLLHAGTMQQHLTDGQQTGAPMGDAAAPKTSIWRRICRFWQPVTHD